MNRRPTPSPVRTEGRHRWGNTVIEGRAVRFWADLRNGRVVVQLDVPEPTDVGVVVAIGPEPSRPLLLVNPQQRPWAGTTEARAALLSAAVTYYRTVEARA
ncbi:hypothetical protein [Glycomyces arizonensis]|uniref:hypothetical protein n=1 Tax=Glycomyces arizonensis TaxID=256035 RepID=UPI0004786B73|nr:hypothetical protein [Glycomyces arizonensis]